MIEKIETYIEGLDDKMQGGIPKQSVVLLVGEPGTMKSSVAFNILFNNAKDKKAKGVYITLEQSTKSLVRHMKGMGMDQADVAESLEIVDLGLLRKKLTDLQHQSWMQVFKMYVQNLKETLDYDILVIDSLPVLNVIAKFEDPRENYFKLFEWLRDLDVTTLLISEMNPDSKAFTKHDEDFLADGIIYLRMMEQAGTTVQRHIRCVKLRSTDHSTNYFTLLFDNGRFKATKVIGDSKN